MHIAAFQCRPRSGWRFPAQASSATSGGQDGYFAVMEKRWRKEMTFWAENSNNIFSNVELFIIFCPKLLILKIIYKYFITKYSLLWKILRPVWPGKHQLLSWSQTDQWAIRRQYNTNWPITGRGELEAGEQPGCVPRGGQERIFWTKYAIQWLNKLSKTFLKHC